MELRILLNLWMNFKIFYVFYFFPFHLPPFPAILKLFLPEVYEIADFFAGTGAILEEAEELYEINEEDDFDWKLVPSDEDM